MRYMPALVALAGLLIFAPRLRAQVKITAVDPDTAKTGDSVSASGEGIDNANVATLYLTNGTDDIKVEILEQNAKLIKFKVPSGAKPGRWALMILTKGNDSKLIEQPVKMTVE
jgi:hypothetical protein